jgi:hypothetical protein
MDLVLLNDDDCKYTPMPDQACKFTKIIVGGHTYTTTDASLCRSPVLADILGRCNDGEIIRLDMEPKYFSLILSYLRTGVVPQQVRLVDRDTMQYYSDYLNIPEIMHPLYDSMKRNLKLLPEITSISQIEKISRLRYRGGLCEDVQLVEDRDIMASFNKHFEYNDRLKCTTLNHKRNYIIIAQKEGDDTPTTNIIFCINDGTTFKPDLTYVIMDGEFSTIAEISLVDRSTIDDLYGTTLLKYESWSVEKSARLM